MQRYDQEYNCTKYRRLFADSNPSGKCNEQIVKRTFEWLIIKYLNCLSAHVIWGAKDQGQNSNLSALMRTTTVDQVSVLVQDLHFSLLTVQRM